MSFHAQIPDFETALTAASDAARRLLGSLQQRPAACVGPHPALPALLQGIGMQEALQQFESQIAPFLSGSAGPRYFGFVTGGVTPAGLLGDWLATAVDQNVSNEVGSIAAAVEAHTAAAFGELFGLGAAFRGGFVSGATQSNTVALATARQALYRGVGIDVAEQGLVGAPALRVLGGAPHASLGKAMSILGMGRASIRGVGCEPGSMRIDVAALARVLESEPAAPTLVLASAGEVNTGEFDDLQALATLCERHGAWLHVDGAFGLFAALDDRRKHLLRGVERADSVSVDLHKWLNVPYDSALIYTRHPTAQREVFRATSAYLGDNPDPLHFTPENSRRFRALPAWFTLSAYGREGIAAWVQRNCELARKLAEGLAELPGVEPLHEVGLNIVSFALTGDSADARDAVLTCLAADGRVFMSPGQLFGRPAIRAALSNWRTSGDDIELSLAAVRDALAARG